MMLKIKINTIIWETWLTSWTLMCIVISQDTSTTTNDPTITYIRLRNSSESGHIQSRNFPHSCCEPQKITLKYDPKVQNQGQIRLTFDDLDLPPGTILRIYEDESESPSAMFRQQPDFKHGTWKRPFIISNQKIIHLVLVPTRSLSARNTEFAGFKAQYNILTGTDNLRLTADLCPPVASSRNSLSITVKTRPTSDYHGRWLDCLWVVKSPSRQKILNISTGSDLQTYVRFEELSLVSGKVEIRQGYSSNASEIVTGQELQDLNQPEEGFQGSDGIYVRAFLQASNRLNQLKFSYGYFIAIPPGSEKEQCRGGFSCGKNLPRTWCIPLSHVCNDVKNCPHGEDEEKCGSVIATTTTTTTTTVAMTTQTSIATTPICPENMHQCEDGRCMNYKYGCNTALHENGGCSITQRYCITDGLCKATYDYCEGFFVTGISCSAGSLYCVRHGYCYNASASCPYDCESYEKQCSDGSCVYDGAEYCLDEKCPPSRMHRCGKSVDCFSNADRCDRFDDCANGHDEKNCEYETHYSNMSKFRSKAKYLFLIVIPVVIVITVAFCYRRFQSKRTINRSSSTATGDVTHEFTPLQPLHSPTQPRRSDRPSPVPSHHPSGDNSSPPRVEPSAPLDEDAPPPSYDEVTHNSAFLATPGDEEQPPTYEKAIEGPSIYIL